MKKLLTAVMLGIVMLCGCQRQPQGQQQTAVADGTFVIEGVVDTLQDIVFPAGSKIWLVPFFGPHPRPVDSCYVEPDGRFRFEGNNELLAIIRLSQLSRYGYQDLLVITQPGTTQVRIGAKSQASGTPANDALQQWKEHVEDYNQSLAIYAQMRQSGHIDPDTYTRETERLRQEAGAFVYDFLKGQGSTRLTRGLNTIRFGTLTDEQKAELDELLHDTTDYSLPQPGFHL